MANKLIILFVLFITFSAKVMGAACCGGGSGLPNIITGDYHAQFSLSYSNSAVVGTGSDDGDFIERSSDNKEVKEVMTLKGAYALTDYFQLGLELPYIQNTYKTNDANESYNSAGDPTVQFTYEFLPELSYSPWKPRGFAFISYTNSITDSVYESDKMLNTDALGTGFDTTYIGFSFSKIKRQLDYTAYLKRGLREKEVFSNGPDKTTVTPGQITTYGIGLGYTPKNGSFRFGTIINSYYEENKKVETASTSSVSSSKSYIDLGLNSSYHTGSHSYGISYVDQSFWGKYSNTNVNKTFAFSVTSFIDL